MLLLLRMRSFVLVSSGHAVRRERDRARKVQPLPARDGPGGPGHRVAAAPALAEADPEDVLPGCRVFEEARERFALRDLAARAGQSRQRRTNASFQASSGAFRSIAFCSLCKTRV